MTVVGAARRGTPRHTPPVPPRAVPHHDVRERWRMGVEARALILVTAMLLAFGLAALYSASAIIAMQEGRGSAYYLLRQLVGAGVGIVVFALAAKTDAERWRRWAWPLMGAVIALMLLCVLPFTEALAPRIHGSRRFLLGSSFQPSELAKLAVVMWTAMLVIKKGPQMRRLTKGLLPVLVIIGLLDLLAWLEPDLSVALFFTLIAAILLYAGGQRLGHFVVLGVFGALVTPFIWQKMERLQYVLLRMTAFWDPKGAPQQVSYQLRQSLIAVGSGRLFGRGFGEGHQQYGFLPFPFSDFIGSNVGEEWGFLGFAGLTVAFSLYAWLGLRIARQARSPFLRLVAIGLTVTTVITAFLHLGVVIGLLPNTGLTLPFISYGRSNLVLSLLMTGILVNIGSTRERVVGSSATDPLAVTAR